LKIAGLRFPHKSLTYGNIEALFRQGQPKTSAWRNQNPLPAALRQGRMKEALHRAVAAPKLLIIDEIGDLASGANSLRSCAGMRSRAALIVKCAMVAFLTAASMTVRCAASLM